MPINMKATEGGYYGWIAVFASFYHHAFVSSSVYGLSVYYSSWVDDFDTGRGLTSWVLTLSMAICMGSGPIASSLSTRFGHRRVIIAGSILGAVGFFLASFATSIYAVVVCIGVMCGFGLGMQYLPSLAIIPFYFIKRRSFAVGVAVSGAGVGVFLYPPFLIWLEEHYTWRGAMLILSGISLNMVVCGALLKPVDETTENIIDTNLPEDTSPERQDFQSKLSVRQTQGVNSSRDNDPTVGSSLHHLGPPNTAETYEPCKFSSTNEIRSRLNSSNGSIKNSDSTHIVSPNHLNKSTHTMHEAGSRKSLGRSHIDIYLSSSIFDLDQADKKRNSFRELHRPESREVNISCPPSHLDSLLQLSKEHHEKSSTLEDSPPCRSSLRKFTTGSCCPKLPTKYIDILENPFFTSLALCYILICFTTLVPVAYIVDRAEDNGVGKADAALAFSMYGAGNLFGRVAIGVLADRGLDSFFLGAACLLISGVSTCLSPMCGANAILHGLYGFTFGTSMGGWVTLTPLVLVDLLGLDMVSRSLGVLLVFMATGLVLGTPMAGWIFDATKSYTLSFIVHGAMVVVAAFITLSIKIALVRSRRRAAAAAVAATFIASGVLNEDDKYETNADVRCEEESINDDHNYNRCHLVGVNYNGDEISDFDIACNNVSIPLDGKHNEHNEYI